ncbi:MAG: HEAT repeat domain-containing protein [Leptospiraceae bacterium]|nr:HEAT repeat domain-containing protein [Leptospiraceae bacterium]MDW8306404.1 HEAT repeat domain-containing protein [Leptospiraceae bacterium]
MALGHKTFIFLLLYLNACRTVSSTKEVTSYGEKHLPGFAERNWQQKVELFELWDSPPRREADLTLIQLGLEEENAAVLVATLQYLMRYPVEEKKPSILHLLAHPESMVRWYALLALERLPPQAEDLSLVAARLSDKEWLVREAALRSFRRYAHEKKEKSYFYQIIFHLEERNPSVLREVYRTLLWYEDDRAFPYLLRRTYVARSGAELIATLEELLVTERPEVTSRIRAVARTHSRPDVRHAASQLLRQR